MTWYDCIESFVLNAPPGFNNRPIGVFSTFFPARGAQVCLNGRFAYSGGDCFAEAWLQKAGGGAVSFEGGTTNESWVPPCDAQRGIIDSLRDRLHDRRRARQRQALLHGRQRRRHLTRAPSS
jgi:hypothetical protein